MLKNRVILSGLWVSVNKIVQRISCFFHIRDQMNNITITNIREMGSVKCTYFIEINPNYTHCFSFVLSKKPKAKLKETNK